MHACLVLFIFPFYYVVNFPYYRINTCFLSQPDGFPTILFYPAGKKSFEPITFEGDRTVVEMYKFIKKHASIPFKLKRPDSSATKTEKDQSTASTNLRGERSSGTNFKDEL
jgi:protein disulfide-isomerase A1